MNNDAQLITRTLAGHSEAFGQLVRKYQDRLYNTVVHVLGNREDAKDVVQEAFVQAFLKLESFRARSTFYTWLYRIAFNAAADPPAPAGSRAGGRTSQSKRQRRPHGGRKPVPTLEREERCRQVRQAIARLNEEQRAVLVLREIDGCCYETIAEILDLPVARYAAGCTGPACSPATN